MAIEWIVIIASFGYLIVLFLIAACAEKNAHRSWLSSPYIYALTLAVYCTAWTYYGSVGRAANQGLDFLTTYIGPILAAPLFWLVLRKIIRICKSLRITTLADFISSRYGKSFSLGAIVTIICVLAIIPYMSIQLKAISSSFSIFSTETANNKGLFIDDSAFYITMVIGVFVIFFGSRKIDSSQRNIGLVSAIAFESLFKLFAFVVLGFYVTYGMYNGFGDIFKSAAALPEFEKLTSLQGENSYTNWFWLNVLSMLAIVMLPRQFHVAVKENGNETHLKKAMWLFPLYLLLINLFVIPVALGGKLFFADQAIDADTYVLAMPLATNQPILAILVYLGGFSAATSMIIVSTSALTIMVNNNIIVPLILQNEALSELFGNRLNTVVLRGKQVMIIIMLVLAYMYFKLIGEKFSLVSIGLISFAGIAQFAPAVIGALFWKNGNKKGAIASIMTGFAIWFIILVVPTIVSAKLLPESIITDGLFGMSFLKPNSFMGLSMGNIVVQGTMWSLLMNTLVYITVSSLTSRSIQETNQSEVFVDIFKYSTNYESAILWKGKAFNNDIKRLLTMFLGTERTDRAFRKFHTKNDIQEGTLEADFRVVNYAEKLLAGAVGSASARVMISSVVKEDKVNLQEVFDILQETQRYISDNKELKRKSEELRETSTKLMVANANLTKMDRLKDEFISTVTHEMRTPITSIRAFSEILNDNEDLDPEERANFLKTIVDETMRMERLINQVLDLEKMESGKISFELVPLDINSVLNEALASMEQSLQEKDIKINKELSDGLPLVSGNKDRLIQVILNLISNARKFCNYENGLITLRTLFVDGHVQLSVIDNGTGIPKESQEMIFEAFYQAENQTLKKPEGTGLGLTISKKIIDRHNGEIWVTSKTGEGTEVAFKLPLN